MVAAFAFLLAATLPLQVRFATCPDWKTARKDTLWTYADSAYVAHPTAVAASGNQLVALAGHTSGAGSNEDRRAFGGVVFEENGTHLRTLTQPAGNFSFEGLKTVADSRGRVHSVWAETLEDSSGGRRDPRLELWHSRLDGTHWTEPDRILASRTLEWNDASLGNVAIGTDDRIHIVLVQRGEKTMQGEIVHIASDGPGWVADTMLTERPATDPAILLTGRHADIAFISAVIDPVRDDENSVWVTTFDLDRREFAVPLLVKQSGIDPANGPHFFRQSDGTLYLFWIHRQQTEVFFNQIAGASKTPGTDVWKPFPSLVSLPHPGIRVLGVAEDPCGSLHLMTTLFADAFTTQLVVLTLRNREWLALHDIQVGMTFPGRAQWIAAPDGTPRIILSATPWTRAWTTATAPLVWQLFTMR